MAGAAAALTDAELAELARRFEEERAEAVVAWAVESFHPRLLVAASMTDAVLIDLVTRIEPSVEVLFIDTGYHFPETLRTAEEVRRRYRLNLKVMGPPDEPGEFWRVDPVGCCSAFKVSQLDAALEGKEAWMSGLRRDEAPTRADAPVVARDRRGVVKVNPLATWSGGDVARYIEDNDIPVNPLVARGYPSIGCWPCTRPVDGGDDPRAGRWPGSAKTECGLHA